MTETLLSRLEEKLMLILAELEKLRSELFNVKKENAGLKLEREKVEERLKSLMSLFDEVHSIDPPAAMMNHGLGNKPISIQG